MEYVYIPIPGIFLAMRQDGFPKHWRLSENDKREIINRYYAHEPVYGENYVGSLAKEYRATPFQVYSTLRNAYFTHYKYCEYCLSTAIHQAWCGRPKC